MLFYEIPSSGMWAFMERFGVEYIDMGISEVGVGYISSHYSESLGPVFVGIFGNRIRRKETILFCLLVSAQFVFIHIWNTLHMTLFIMATSFGI